MRTSQAQRYAKWSAGVAIVLVLVVAGVYLRGRLQARQAQQQAPPAVPSTVQQRSEDFSYSKVQGGQTIFTVRASEATEFTEGSRSLLEDVSISIYGKDGLRNDRLETKACDFFSSTGEISCAGEVQMDLEPAVAAGKSAARGASIHVATVGVRFQRDSGEARTDHPVRFDWPGGKGTAQGARYDSNGGTLELVRDVQLNLASAQPAGAPAESDPAEPVALTGERLTFGREARVARMQGTVRARQRTRELSADTLTVEMDAGLHARRVVAGGHPQLRDSDPASPISLDADEIYAVLAPGGWAESIVAGGNVRGQRSGPAGQERLEAERVELSLAGEESSPRLLTARGGVLLVSLANSPSGGTRRVETEALQMSFSNREGNEPVRLDRITSLAPASGQWQTVTTSAGKTTREITRMRAGRLQLQFGGEDRLRQLDGSGGVELTRQAGEEPEQTTSSRELTAQFGGDGEWSRIDQIGEVRFRQGERTAQSDRARIERGTGSVTLTGAVVVADPSSRTTAQSATLLQGNGEFRADGGVVTSEMGATSARVANLAPAAAHIAADHLAGNASAGRAVYSGHARLWQGASVIEANTIALDNRALTVHATGQVLGVFPQAGKTAGAQPQLWRVQAGALIYWNADSRARLEHDVIARSSQDSIRAPQMDLFFAPAAPGAAQQLVRAAATGGVEVRQRDRRASSERADYSAAERKFILSGGNPTLYDSTGDSITGRQLTFFFADDRIVVDSGTGSRTVTLHRVEK